MSPATFLVVGEAIVDVIHQGSAVERHPGGSPTNVAVGLARLGHQVLELSYLGDDADGDLIRRHLRDAGIRLHPAGLPAPATSFADVALDAAGDASYRFSVAWDVPTAINWNGVDVVHAGSIALGLDPGSSHALELLQSRPPGVRVTIDPNVREPFLPQGEQPAARMERFFALADLVKLSAEDAQHLYPHLERDEVIDRILSLGPGLVAFTSGADGAVLATAAARVHAQASAPHVVDTVGAGDSFMAALVSAVAETNDWVPERSRLESFGAWAARAAGITVSRAGADPPTREQLG